MSKIAIGADHRGFVYKQAIIQQLKKYDWLDVGTHEAGLCNFPVYVQKVVQSIQDGSAQRGVLLCGSGVGMTIAANRFPKIYAALAWNVEIAKLSRQHNNSNILSLPADFVSLDTALAMIEVWCETDFLGGRYQGRIDMIDMFS